ncbi:hypothetical protein SAMN02745831_06578 [Streptomyces sp. PgraA7]|nr:hypothetical protein SAMN02745831_06578 [Streptomyces sp. PgraA7]
MRSTDLNVIGHPPGKCLLCVRRLSRKLATSAPERQGDILVVAGDICGDNLRWADDWEVLGARLKDPPKARAVAWREKAPTTVSSLLRWDSEHRLTRCATRGTVRRVRA